MQTTKNLQTIVILIASLGILTISGLVAIASIVPLSQRLRQAEEKNLTFAVGTRKLVVEEYLSKAKEVSAQITSRTRGRQLLEGFNRGEVELNEFITSTQNILTDALQQSEDVVGIMRLDRDRQPRVNVGLQIPPAVFTIPPDEVRVPLAESLVELEGILYLVVEAPILNPQRERVGTDIVLYRTDNLRGIVVDYIGLGQTGEMVLARDRQNSRELFFPLRDGTQTPSAALEQAIARSLSGERGLLNLPTAQEIIAYDAITGSLWGLAVQMNKTELYRPLNRQLWQIGGMIIGLSVLGSGGIFLLLRPLTRRTIEQTEFLEQQMRSKSDLLVLKSSQLQQEEQTRQLVREVLQQMDELQGSARQVAEFAGVATQVSQQGYIRMQEGLTEIAVAREGIEQLQLRVETISTQIERLNENTRQISGIADLVNDLAAQTNMLALNASVEAVRAGEQGRGFSVIATEVRKLADRSRESVEQINQQLDTIQRLIQSILALARGSNEQVKLSRNTTEQAVQTLQKMQQAIAKVQQNSQQISLATNEQATAIDRVVQAMPNIS